MITVVVQPVSRPELERLVQEYEQSEDELCLIDDLIHSHHRNETALHTANVLAETAILRELDKQQIAEVNGRLLLVSNVAGRDRLLIRYK